MFFWEKKRWDEGQERCPNKDDHADFFHPSGVPPAVSNWYYKAACEICNRPILHIRNRGYRIESGAGSFDVPGTGYSLFSFHLITIALTFTSILRIKTTPYKASFVYTERHFIFRPAIPNLYDLKYLSALPNPQIQNTNLNAT